jgi:toxin ParE1/3/4
MKVILRSIAEDDVAAAVEWYERRAPGPGDRFLLDVRQTLARIGEHPEAYPLVHPPRLRRILLPDFPYGLFYLVEADRTACGRPGDPAPAVW